MPVARPFMTLALACLPVLPLTALAAPQEQWGYLDAQVDMDRLAADAVLTGALARSVFQIVSARSRVESVSPTVRRVGGPDVTCDEEGALDTDPSGWWYTCNLTIQEGGVVSRTPAP